MQLHKKLRLAAIAALATSAPLVAQVHLDDTVITATPEPRAEQTLAAPVTVINRADIESTRAVDVPDLLRAIGGLEVIDVTGSRGRTTQIDMRGFGETASTNLAVIVDGRTLNSATLAGTDWTTIPLERIDRIEIVRGSGAVMYGDNATAGVINIVTRKNADFESANRISLETRASQYSDWRHNASASGGDDRLSWNLDGGWNDFDGWRDNADVTYQSLGAGIAFTANDIFKLSLNGGWKKDEYGLPGALVPSAPPRSTTMPGNRAESEDSYLSVIPEFQLGNSLVLRLPIHLGETISEADFSGYPVESRIRQVDFRPSASFDAQALSLAHRMTIGVDWRTSELDRAVNTTPATREETALWVQDSIALKEKTLFLDLGLRVGQVDYDYKTLTDSDHDLTAASAGLSWIYREKSRFFTSVQRGYRTQLLDELNFVFNPGTGGFDPAHPALDPQTSVTIQSGIRHAFNEHTTAAITAFVINTEDEIFYNPAIFANSAYGKTRRTGLEFEVVHAPTETLTLSGFLTVLDSELRGGVYDGNRIPGTTPISMRLHARWQPIENLSLDARFRWSKDRSLISDWADASPSWNDDYKITDVSVSWRLTEIITVYAGCNNLFDTRYSEYGVVASGSDFTLGTADDQARIYPSPEREYFGGVRLTLQF